MFGKDMTTSAPSPNDLEFPRDLPRDLLLWMSTGLGAIFTIVSVLAFWGGFSGLFYPLVKVAGAVLLFMWFVAALACFSYTTSFATKTILALCMVVFLLPGLILGGLPVTATDALVHHLAVPKWWIAAGRPFPIFWHEWSFYPMLLNWAYVGVVAGPGDSVAAFCHWLLFLPLVAVTANLCRECTDSDEAGFIGVIVSLSLPLWVRLSSVPLVDLGLALFSAQATLFLVKVLRGNDRPWSNVIGAGFSIGFALSTKYNGLLFAGVSCFAFLVVAAGSVIRAKRASQYFVVMSVTSLIIFSPWLLKNFQWTGNPLFPLMKSFLGGPALSLPGAPKGVAPILHRIYLYGENWVDLLALPFRIFVTGQDGNPARFDGVLTPLLLLSFIPLVFRRKSPQLSYLLLTALGYLGICLVISGARVRYLAPALPGLIACLSVALHHFSRNCFRRRLVWGMICLNLVWAGMYVAELLKNPGVPQLLNGTLDRTNYLRQEIAEYPVIEYANAVLGDKEQVYLITTGNSFYYFDRPVLSRGYYSANEMISWLRSGKSAGEIRQSLSNLGVTHLMVNSERLLALMAPLLTPEQGQVWNTFSKDSLELIFNSRGYSLWRIK